mmetsp:Transcript_16730/g.18804  ORF Transcript_16730/g.18804 Transcript_16730/m.18804 type:complete len:100 (-) Transcript_16730:452-751(-)
MDTSTQITHPLIETIKQSRHIEMLRVGRHILDDSFGVRLADAMMVNNSVVVLDFWGFWVMGQSDGFFRRLAVALARILKVNTSIRELVLGRKVSGGKPW